MLGSLRSNKDWVWAAFGKHPVARDFIRLGSDLPIFNAFCNWVEHGFGIMRHGDNHRLNSWRFWAKGTKRSHLVCGLVRDSHDSICRPYPCLIIGTGPLADWKDHWEELPVVLEESWSTMEYLFVKSLNTINELSGELNRLRPEHTSFSDHKEFDHDDQQGTWADLNCSEIDIRKEGVLHHVLRGDNPCADAARWLNGFSSANSPVPNAVFLGGVPEKNCLVLFERSLMPSDFVQLWSVGL